VSESAASASAALEGKSTSGSLGLVGDIDRVVAALFLAVSVSALSIVAANPVLTPLEVTGNHGGGDAVDGRGRFHNGRHFCDRSYVQIVIFTSFFSENHFSTPFRSARYTGRFFY